MVALLASLFGCNYSKVNPISGAGPPRRVNVPDAIDFTSSGMRLHLDPTVMLWARDAKLNLRSIVRDATTTIERALDGPPVDVSISAGSYFAIPDVGIGGFTDPVTGNVTISMDSQSPVDLDELLSDWLPMSMAHELHHSKRILDGPGYGSTLLDAMITEGSAETFVRETYPNAPVAPWVKSLGRAERKTWRAAREVLDRDETADLHHAWFFGGGDLPRWAGYRIGYAIAVSYLESHPKVTAADLATMSSGEIFGESGYEPSV